MILKISHEMPRVTNTSVPRQPALADLCPRFSHFMSPSLCLAVCAAAYSSPGTKSTSYTNVFPATLSYPSPVTA